MTDARSGRWSGLAVGVGLLAVLFAATAVLAGQGPARGPGGRLAAQRYIIDSTVLESRSHGPQLCAGGIAQSLPPQCGGFPVEPFRWADVPGRRSMFGTTWAEVHLEGTFDGRAFHVLSPPAPARPKPPAPPLAGSACPTPPGGWTQVDPSRDSEGDAGAAMTQANSQPDVAAVWFSWPDGVVPDGSSRRAVLNLGFTGDIERHFREARTHWSGALCVVQMARTRAELVAVNADLFSRADEEAAQAGVYLLGGDVDEAANTVKLFVLIADPPAQQWVDHRYGPGVVTLEGSFRPVASGLPAPG